MLSITRPCLAVGALRNLLQTPRSILAMAHRHEPDYLPSIGNGNIYAYSKRRCSIFRQSLIGAAVAVATITAAASIGLAQTHTGAHQRTVVHQAYTYEPAPNPVLLPVQYHLWPYYYGRYGQYYYGPSPAAPVANAAGAAVCAAFSLIGAC